MLGNFPDPYPDELLLSMCTRFADRMAYPTTTAALCDLFDTGARYPAVDLPSQLQMLVDRLPPGHGSTLDRLLQEHTLLPYYAPFSDPDTLHQAQIAMAFGTPEGHPHTGSQIHTRLPGPTRVKRSRWLRYCPACVLDDRARYGECYWRRLPQVAGVTICPTHGCWLEDSTVPANIINHAFVRAEDASLLQIPRSATASPHYSVLLRLATTIEQLLTYPLTTPPGRQFLRTQLLALLGRQGFISSGGYIFTRPFLAAFVQHYPHSLLSQLGCALDPQSEDPNWLKSWLFALLTERGGNHPLYYLLLCDFCHVPFDALVSEPIAENTPLGNGPWPCLNPFCEYFELPSPAVRRVSLYRIEEKLMARYACTCGYIYSQSVRIGHCEGQEAPVHVVNVARPAYVFTRGPLWEAAFRSLWEDLSYSLPEIAERVHMHPGSLRRYALRLHIVVPERHRVVPAAHGATADVLTSERASKRRAKCKVKHEAKRRANRKAWLSMRRNKPLATRSQLRRSVLGLYAWLWRHDRDWLEAHLPPKRRAGCERRALSVPVETHEAADRSMAEQIVAIASLLRARPGPPQRISKILLLLNSSHLTRLDKHTLGPRAREALEQVIETHEHFAVRRIQYFADQHRDCPHPVTKQSLINTLSLQRYGNSPAVQQALEQVLESINGSLHPSASHSM